MAEDTAVPERGPAAAEWNRLDMSRFWRENEACLRGGSPPGGRVPVLILGLNGVFFCERLGFPMRAYYSDYETQQRVRLAISPEIETELGLPVRPGIDWGVVLDGSVFGGRVIYLDESSPELEPVVREPGDVHSLARHMQGADLMESGLLPEYFRWRETLARDYGVVVRERQLERKGAGTIAAQLCGASRFLGWLYSDRREMHYLVDLITEVLLEFVARLRGRLGHEASGLGQADDIAGLMSPAMFREFIYPGLDRLFGRFAPADDDERAYHCDSRMGPGHLEALGELGVNWVNLGPEQPAALIHAVLPQATICGQVPPNTLLHGSPEDVVAAARRDLEAVGPSGRLLLSTAGAVAPGTSYENIRALCYAAEPAA